MSEVGLFAAMARPRGIHQSAPVKNQDSEKGIEMEVKEPESYSIYWSWTAPGTVTGLSWEEAVRQQARD